MNRPGARGAQRPERPEGRVKELWRYPASSLAGEALAAADIGESGLDGDRLYGVIETATGDIARPVAIDGRWKTVASIAARLGSGDRLEVRTPGADWVGAPGATADRAVSTFLGFAAAVVPLSGERTAGSHGGPLGIARYERAPVHLLTTASLAELATSLPAGVADARRFRPNIVVDWPAEPGHFPETEWIGRRLAIGEVELAVAMPCRRCGFTIHAQGELEEAPQVLREIVRRNARDLGVYCTVRRPGTVHARDAVRLLD